MIDLLAAGKQVAAELAALNPQVIRNLSAGSNAHPAYIPAIPQNPQPLECKKINDPLDGLELLPDDHRWVRALLQRLPASRQRELLVDYRRNWMAAYDAEHIEHKKSNRGRFAANVWLAQSLELQGFKT